MYACSTARFMLVSPFILSLSLSFSHTISINYTLPASHSRTLGFPSLGRRLAVILSGTPKKRRKTSMTSFRPTPEPHSSVRFTRNSLIRIREVLACMCVSVCMCVCVCVHARRPSEPSFSSRSESNAHTRSHSYSSSIRQVIYSWLREFGKSGEVVLP